MDSMHMRVITQAGRFMAQTHRYPADALESMCRSVRGDEMDARCGLALGWGAWVNSWTIAMLTPVEWRMSCLFTLSFLARVLVLAYACRLLAPLL